MRRFPLLAGLALVLLFAFAPASRASARNCGVLELAGTGETITRNFVVNLTSLLASEIEDRKTCDRLETYGADSFADGCTGDEACLSDLAKGDDLDYVLAGAVRHDGGSVVLRLRLFDAGKGRFVEIMQSEIPSEPNRMAAQVAQFAETFHDIARPGEAPPRGDDDDSLAMEMMSEEELLAEPELFGGDEGQTGPAEEAPDEDFDAGLASLRTDTLDRLAEEDRAETGSRSAATGSGAGAGPVDFGERSATPDDAVARVRRPPVALRATAGVAHYQRALAEVGLGIDVRLWRMIWLDAEVDGWFGSVPAAGGAAGRQPFVLTPVALGVRLGDMSPAVAPHVGVAGVFVCTHVDRDTGQAQIAPGARLTGGVSFRLGARARLQLDGSVGLTHAADLGARVGDDSFADTAVAVAVRLGLLTLP